MEKKDIKYKVSLETLSLTNEAIEENAIETQELGGTLQNLVVSARAVLDPMVKFNPKYTVHKAADMSGVGHVEVFIQIRRDKILDIHFEGDFQSFQDVDKLMRDLLKGIKFERNELAAALMQVKLDDIIVGLKREPFLSLLFGKLAHVKKPDWLKISLGKQKKINSTSKIIQDHSLHTICGSGLCPNRTECWSQGTATFMIGGNICTRSCRFCNTTSGIPLPLEPNEPRKVAESIKLLQLKYAVITSVDRDDLPDLGAEHWVKTIEAIRELNPNTRIEVLIPDFLGRLDLLDKVIATKPDVIAHNIETVRRLTPAVRAVAKYDQSLSVLAHIAKSGITAKTGIMLGLGESQAEVIETMQDVHNTGCKILTIGQYLQPTYNHIAVMEYISPEQFERYKVWGEEMGIASVVSGPLVRSSYHAAESAAVL